MYHEETEAEPEEAGPGGSLAPCRKPPAGAACRGEALSCSPTLQPTETVSVCLSAMALLTVDSQHRVKRTSDPCVVMQ